MTDGPTQMARNQKRRQTEKPTLEEAIRETGEFLKILAGPGECLQPKDFFAVCRSHVIPALRRLLEAAEQSEDAIRETKEKIYRWAGEHFAEKDRRIEELDGEVRLLAEKRDCFSNAVNILTKELDKLRTQLAEKERELEQWKEHAWKLDQSIIELVKTFGKKPNPEPTEALKELCRIADRIGGQELKELARQVKADIHSDTPLGERLRTKLLEPTEAEVEKVAEQLYCAAKRHCVSVYPADYHRQYDDERIRWRNLARHVMRQGYRPEEE